MAANLIQPTTIPGLSVYGVVQKSYTVEGEPGLDYAAALTAATLRESVAIEDAANGYSELVRQRGRKVSDLGDALATLSWAAASFAANGQSSDELSGAIRNSARFQAAWQTCKDYDILTSFPSTRGALYRAQNDVQYALDQEDNNLQQDMVSLQGLISKRDSAYSTAARLVNKSLNASNKTIGNMR
jgi:hypothetical protein